MPSATSVGLERLYCKPIDNQARISSNFSSGRQFYHRRCISRTEPCHPLQNSTRRKLPRSRWRKRTKWSLEQNAHSRNGASP